MDEQHESHPQNKPAGPDYATLLNYESQLVEELLDDDKLCIIAAGLGWQRVVAVFLRLHHYHQEQPGVVLVLGCHPWQRDLLGGSQARFFFGFCPGRQYHWPSF